MNKTSFYMSLAIIAQFISHNTLATASHNMATQIFRHPNGATLLVREDNSAPVVSVQAWVASGSIHEDQWLGSGISHFVEHMLFKGTTRRGVGQIAREAHELGGRMNAYTSLDRTVYFIDLPSTGWASALDILVDAIFHSTFPEEEFLKEQEVIRREFAMGKDDPARVATLELLATAFTTHPYRYPTIGHLELFNKLTREDLVAYHAGRYVPENITFVVVGNVSAQAVQEEFEKLLQAVPRRFMLQPNIPAEPAQLAPRFEVRTFPTELLHLRMGWHVPGITHQDAHALDVLAVILGQGLSSRLHQALVEKQNLAHSISAFSFTPRDQGIFAVAAVADPEREQDLLNAIQEEIQRLIVEGISEDELRKAHNQVLTSFLSGLETMDGQAADIGQSWFLARNPDYSANYTEKIRAVTRDSVQQAAAKYLTSSTLSTVILRPAEESVPEGAPPRKDWHINAQTHHPAITRHTLANGLRILHQHQTRLPLATLQIVWLSGLLAEDAETNGLARLTANLLLKGTATRSAEQIATTIENLGGSISIETGQNTTILSLSFLSQDFPTAAELAADLVLNPSFPEEELQRERSLQIAAIRRERDQPMAICSDLLRQHLYGAAHPYSRNPLGTEERLDTFTVDHIRSFYTRTLRAGSTVLAIFGDVSTEVALPLLEKLFSPLPSDAFAPPLEYASASDVASSSAQPLRVSLTIPKQQAVIQIGFPGIALLDPDRPAYEVLIQALSDMSSPLFHRIREEQGLAYFVGAAQRIGILPGHAVLYAGAAPDKAEHVISELLAQAKHFAQNSLNLADITRAQTKLISELLMQRQSISALARTAALNELYGLGADATYTADAQIAAVTPEDIRRAAARLFTPAPVVSLVSPSVGQP